MSESGFRRPWMAKLRRWTSMTSGVQSTAPAARRTPSCEFQLVVPAARMTPSCENRCTAPAARMTPSCEIRLPSRTPATSHTSSCGVGARCFPIAAVLLTIFRVFTNEFVAFWAFPVDFTILNSLPWSICVTCKILGWSDYLYTIRRDRRAAASAERTALRTSPKRTKMARRSASLSCLV